VADPDPSSPLRHVHLTVLAQSCVATTNAQNGQRQLGQGITGNPMNFWLEGSDSKVDKRRTGPCVRDFALYVTRARCHRVLLASAPKSNFVLLERAF